MMKRSNRIRQIGLVLVGVLGFVCLAGNCLVGTSEEGKLEKSDLFLFQETFMSDEKIESIMDDLSRVDNEVRLELITIKDDLIDINQSEFVKKENWQRDWTSYAEGNKAKLSYEFTGTKLEILALVCGARGKMRIKIDGDEASIIDIHREYWGGTEIIPIASRLENKLHKVEVLPISGLAIVSGFLSSIEEYPSSGTLISPPIILPDNLKWGKVFYKKDTPEGTSIRIDVLDLKGKVLLSNISEERDLSGLKCRGVKLRATFTTSNLYLSPSLKELSVSYSGKCKLKDALSGIVINSEGEAIENASISVLKDGTLQFEAKTSSKGVYSTSKLNPGRYSLQISASGYLCNIFEVEIPCSFPRNFLLYKKSDIPDCSVWSVNALVKILKKDKPFEEDVREIHIEAAQNEYEPCQIVVTPSFPLRLKVRTNSLVHTDGKHIIDKTNVISNFIGYVPVRYNYSRITGQIAKAPMDMPDPLLLEGEKLLKKNENQPIWITVKTPKDALPGDYRGEIDLITQYGIIKKIKLNLHVYRFQLKDASDEPHIWANSYFMLPYLHAYYGLETFSPEWWEFHEEVFIKNRNEHRLNSTYWSAKFSDMVKIYYSEKDKTYAYDYTTFDRCIKMFPGKTKHILTGLVGRESKTGIMKCSRLQFYIKETGKRIDFGGKRVDEPEPGVIELILDIYKNLERHLEEKGWLDKVCIALCDEPSEETVENYVKYSAQVHKAAPKLHRFEAAQSERVEDALETICKGVSGRPDEKDYHRVTKKGTDFWIYTTGTIAIDVPAIRARLLPWIAYRYGFKGYHRSGYAVWHIDPWRVCNIGGGRFHNTEPGKYWLVYPDPERKTFINSIGYEMLREGLEDYEYLWTLEHTGEEIAKKFGWSKNPALIKAKAFAKEIFPSYDMYKQDPEQLYRIRRKIAEEICRLKERPYLIVNMEPSPTVGAISPGIVVVEGMAEEGSEVLVDGRKVKVSSKGEFSAKVGISYRKNHIEVLAKKDGKEKRIREIFSIGGDKNIVKLKEAIGRVKELGADTSLSEGVLQEYERVTKESIQPEEIKGLVNSAIKEVNKLHQQEIDILFEKVSSRGKGRTKVYQNMIREIKRYYKSGDYADKRFLLTEALSLDKGCAKREEGNCFIIPFFHHKRKAYKLINSKIEVIIWREGGRIISFKVNGVPVLKHNEIDVLGKKRINVGGYEDAGKMWRWESNLEEWEAGIVKDNPEEVVLSCSKAVSKPGEEGYLIKREMSIRKDDPGLKISYTITNPTDKPSDYTWRGHTIFAIGRSKENEGGDPSGDEFIIPASEALPHLECNSYKEDFDKMFILNKPFAGVIDREEKTSIFFLIDPLIRKLYFWCGGGKSGYTFEPWLEFSLGGGDSIEFDGYLVGFSGITNPREVEAKVESYINAIR